MMDIHLENILVKDIFDGYVDNDENGVFAYKGKLSIRPPYQREFIYNEEDQKAVIDTMLKGFPLNVMYWVKTDKDDYEVMDGQQRTLSIMHFLKHQFKVRYNEHECYWDNLGDDLKKIMEYPLMIYICEGGDKNEKLEWFKTINIAGKELTDQELRNPYYVGKWLTDAKAHFSKNNCVGYNISKDYYSCEIDRQELLEIALKGISEYQKLDNLQDYMAKHQNDEDANELWQYFQDVINWADKIFEKHYKEMKNLDWCRFFNEYSINSYNSKKIADEVSKLMIDDEIGSRKGIFEYVLDKENPFREKYLNLRGFSDNQKRLAYEKQKGICPICKKHFDYSEMEGDHHKPWSQGGKTEQKNCIMLCKDCNRQKSNK